MEITETERLMLTKKKEEICELTLRNLDLAHDSQKELEIKKNFTTILSLLSQVASYSNSKNVSLDKFTDAMNILFLTMSQEKLNNIWVSAPVYVQILCNYANSIRFDFTKKDVKITFPKNINLNILTILNK